MTTSPTPAGGLRILRGQARDLGGGFTVARVLPAAAQRSVGPFVFFDHFGPLTSHGDPAHDVRPHPHIGLATVTYLFDGAMQHHDSTGARQRIEPGAINWMSAGRGIVHSERAPEDLRGQPYAMHGLQLWAALPPALEESEPAFSHTPASAIPRLRRDDAELRLLVGELQGVCSPVPARMPTLFVDLLLPPGGVLQLDAWAPQQALYPIDDGLTLADGTSLAAREMVVLDRPVRLHAASSRTAPLRAVLIGGAPLDAPRAMWWNFVSSRRERIAQAAQDWAAGRFPPVPGETESIPLPPGAPTA